MYKSKLQELCHRRSWSLPKYEPVKEGPDHSPCFTCIVFVNGHSFQTPDLWKVSRGAQNEAARLAFKHLSVLPPLACSACFNALPPGIVPPPPSEDMRSVFTNQLEKFAQQRSLALPTYHFERESSPHDLLLRFKCKVSIDGRTYETVESFNTSKEAQHAAAGIALMALSYDTFQEVECASYKNLLVDFTKKQGYCLPIYGTVMDDESHKQIFVSTVEIEGESFTGQEATTKKMADCSAAKVAYITLKERTSVIVSSTSQSPELRRENAALSSSCPPADDHTGHQQNVTTAHPEQRQMPRSRKRHHHCRHHHQFLWRPKWTLLHCRCCCRRS